MCLCIYGHVQEVYKIIEKCWEYIFPVVPVELARI